MQLWHRACYDFPLISLLCHMWYSCPTAPTEAISLGAAFQMSLKTQFRQKSKEKTG